MDISDFLVKDYELKTRFLTDHFSRMWTRFNYFLATETAIVGGKVILAPPEHPNTALLWLGLVVSALWYLMGAQDKYLVELYREELEVTFKQMKEANKYENTADKPLYAGPLYYVGQVKDVKLGLKGNPGKWRLSLISTTYLAAWIPLLVTGFWIVWLLKS